MRNMMKLRRIFLSLLAIVILMCITAPTASYADRQANEAAEASEGKSGETDKELPGDTTEATDITRRVKIKAKPSCNVNSILDGRNTSVAAVKKDTVLTCTSKVEVGGLYIETEEPAGKIIIETDENAIEVNEENYLHFYVGGVDSGKFTVTFENSVTITNIRFLSKGALPDWVQIWEPAPSECDIMILPAHYDDDTLYFGGIAPWAIDQGASVVVAFYCDHRTEPYRKHEMLDGVWASGIRSYPVLGSYADSGLVDLQRAESQLADAGITWDDMLERQVEIYRKYKPQIILTMSMSGEYGHPQHIIYARLAAAAVFAAGDPATFPELAGKYGVHTVSKIYVHNYLSPTDRIILDLDSPLDSFDGRTPYEIAISAFSKHKTQVSGFISWLKGPMSAANIQDYSPCEWGLYYSEVGSGTSTDTFFDGITLIKDRGN